MVDFLIPVVILVVMSLLTERTDPVRVGKFYARLKTPVGATPEEDERAVEDSYANPTRYDHQKLWPKSDWEFTKWDKVDTLGFLTCCGLVGVVLVVFKAAVTIGG
jgi:energy-coupling factor transporter transmembrane protein EcfT